MFPGTPCIAMPPILWYPEQQMYEIFPIINFLNFRSINETTCRLQRLIERYQDRIYCKLTFEKLENNCSKF